MENIKNMRNFISILVTLPAMWAWNNNKTGKPISNIIHENRLVSFNFMDPNLGIVDIEKNNKTSLQIIPNPANEYMDLKITNNSLLVTNIEFYNIFGQLVKSVPYNAEIQGNTSTQRIPITDLSKGMFFIRVGNETAKLIVQ